MTDPAEREAIAGAAHQFLQDKVFHVGYKDLEDLEEFPQGLLDELADLGYLGLTIGENYGGTGADTVTSTMVARELAYAWGSLHLIWSANGSLSAYPIETFGTEEQKQEFLPLLANGDVYGCYALTEPDAGSDPASMQATAVFDKKKKVWILNGTKTFITNASQAQVCVVFARVDGKAKEKRAKRHEGITAFVFKSSERGLGGDINGITVREIGKHGILCAPFCEVSFQDVELPENAVLGEVGRGFPIALNTLDNGRINIAAQAVGIASRALHEATEYAKSRIQFDSTLIEKQAVYHELANIWVEVEAAWALTLKAAQAKDRGDNYGVEASQAKLFASEAALKAALYAYRIFGGAGYTRETIVMKILHDALATVTYEGASNVQREVIARSL